MQTSWRRGHRVRESGGRGGRGVVWCGGEEMTLNVAELLVFIYLVVHFFFLGRLSNKGVSGRGELFVEPMISVFTGNRSGIWGLKQNFQ